MTENFLVKLFEHKNWANLQFILACSALSGEQLDAESHSVTRKGYQRARADFKVIKANVLRKATTNCLQCP